MTKKEEAAALAAYKADPHHTHKTQFYSIIFPQGGGELVEKVFAVSDTKRHGLRVREINKAESNRDYYQTKDVWKNVWGKYMVEFDERRNRPQEEGGWYRGKWGNKTAWEDASWWCKYNRPANLEALAETGYRFSGYADYFKAIPQWRQDERLQLVPYLQLWKKHPQVELLARAGLWTLITPQFLDKLEARPALAGFVRNHAREIAEGGYTPQEVTRASLHGWTLARARTEAELTRRLSDVTREINRKRLAEYLDRNRIDAADYRAYLHDLQRAGHRPAAFAFPRDFHAARRQVQEEIAKASRKQDARRTAAARRIADRINALLDKAHKRLAARIGDFTVFVPTTRADFETEGQEMHNCIAGYFEAHAARKKVLFFLRRNGARVADVEMTPAGTVLQCRGPHNIDPAREVKEAADYLAKLIATGLRRKAA